MPYTPTNHIRLHYTRTGGDLPPLVLAHGVTDNGRCWIPVARALERAYDVIMVDARGHGRSDAPESGYDAFTQAADHAGLIIALGLDRPIILGHSMGAATALALAGIYPDLPRAIILEDPPGSWIVEPVDLANEEIHAEGMRTWLRSLADVAEAALIAQKRAEKPNWAEAELGPWAASKKQASEHVAGAFTAIHPPEAWFPLLTAVTCPVLLMTADVDQGAAITPEATAVLQQLIPHLQHVPFPDAGHSIRRDQFDPYMATLRQFLVSLDDA